MRLPHQTLPLLLIVAFCSILCHADFKDQQNLQGLIITYKTTPAHRVDLREYMSSEGISHLRELQHTGIINFYQVFFSRYVDNETWDMMLIVSFPDAAGMARWREVELQSPAALTGRGLATVQFVGTTPVNRVRGFTSGQNSSSSVFLIIPYKVLAPAVDYLRYFDGYVVPQLEGWRKEKALLGYELYTAQYPAGRPWASTLVLRYTNDAALADRERIISKIRDRLRNDPSWKAFADNKANIRSEQETVVADELHFGSNSPSSNSGSASPTTD